MKNLSLYLMIAVIATILFWAATRPMSSSEATSILIQTGTINKAEDAIHITIDSHPLEIELEAVAAIVRTSNLPVILKTN